MPKVTDLMKSTSHAQQAEVAQFVGSQSSDNTALVNRITELEGALQTAIAKQSDLTTELQNEQEAHARTSAALAAAVASPQADNAQVA